jgi:methylated-DNA-protein-cysteine methyltransferase-like protein
MPHTPNPGLFEKVYEFVKTVPKGKVATYGQVARALGVRDVRKIGWALHANKSAHVPCHRVVNKEGKLADNFAFDGWEEQRKRLIDEGVVFIDEKHVDLEKSGWENI